MVPDRGHHDEPGILVVRRAVLIQYRVMAYTTAVLLIILVFVGVPLQLAAGRRGVVNVVGTMHGFLYIVYLFTAFRLTFKLRVPLWQTALVLLAGTVPFAAFFAERKMSRRFAAAAGGAPLYSADRSRKDRSARAASVRGRWLSRRALLLHLEVVIVAPGCAVAGWWQATRALSGNGLSWFYSVEWPVFALLAIWGWWHLLHEDPDTYRRRKARLTEGYEETMVEASSRAGSRGEGEGEGVVDGSTVRLARALVALVAAEFVLGIAAVIVIPFSRPGGWVPAKGAAVYAAHASLGVVALLGAIALLVRLRGAPHTARVVGWLGLVSLVVAGAGGLLTEARSTVRFFGMALMLLGTAFAAFAYMVPTLLSSRTTSPSAEPESLS
jgi:integral membrane protein